MAMSHEFESPKKDELDTLGFFNVSPELLAAIELSERGEPLTWGPTPLEPHRPDIAAQQRKVNEEIHRFFPKSPQEVPFGLDWQTAQYIRDNYDMRTAHRVNKNYESFQARGNFDVGDVPIEALGMVERALSGYASPAEGIYVADIEQIPAIELASITHPYGGERIKQLTPMRTAIREAIKLFGGEVLKKNPVYEVRNANFFFGDHRDDAPVLLMTRSLNVGKIGASIDIIERSSFAVILPRLVPENIEEIMSIDYDGTWSKDIMAIPGFEAAVDAAFREKRYDLAVPVSTTTFLVNHEYVKKYMQNEIHLAERRRKIEAAALQHAGKNQIF